MSVGIQIHNAVKRYGDKTIIPDLSVEIHNGEFFTLLGPSGCGKTTLLRMIAGFNTIEGGNFFFNDKRINDMDPGKRNIGMVFQNYAIFPNMTVRKNVEFGLKNRPIPKRADPQRGGKIHEAGACGRICRTVCPTGSPAVSSSAWRWRAHWSSVRTCC